MNKILYDKNWLKEYLDEIKRCENDLQIMKSCLIQVKDSILPEQFSLYLTVMIEIDEVDENFQVMYHVMEDFLSEAQIQALYLSEAVKNLESMESKSSR